MTRFTKCRLAAFLFVTLLVLCVVGRTVGAQTEGAPRSTQPSAVKGWTADSIVAALLWRESQLANCSIGMTEELWYTKSGAAEARVETSRLHVRRRNGAIWIDRTRESPLTPGLDITFQIQSWDGSVLKWIEHKKSPSGEMEINGGFYGKEPDLSGGELMSYRLFGIMMDKNDEPWSKWLQRQLSYKATTAEVKDESVNGEHVVKLKITSSVGWQEFDLTFLPDKDFVLSEFDVNTHTRPEPGKVVEEYSKSQVKQFRHVDGLWVPAEIAVNNSGDPGGNNRREWKLDSFSLKAPTDEEMNIKFPPDTLVMDSIRHEYYRLKADGTKEQMPFYDHSAGKVINPSTQPSTGP